MWGGPRVLDSPQAPRDSVEGGITPPIHALRRLGRPAAVRNRSRRFGRLIEGSHPSLARQAPAMTEPLWFAGATIVPPQGRGGRGAASGELAAAYGWGVGLGDAAAGCAVRVTVVSSKFTLSPARTVTVPGFVLGVSNPPRVILQPRSG